MPALRVDPTALSAVDVENIADRAAVRAAAYILGTAVEIGFITSPASGQVASPTPISTPAPRTPTTPKTPGARTSNTKYTPIVLDDEPSPALGLR
jgi:hypothetical protein